MRLNISEVKHFGGGALAVRVTFGRARRQLQVPVC